MLGRREGRGNQPVQLEVLLERRQAAVRVRDQPDLDAAAASSRSAGVTSSYRKKCWQAAHSA